MPETKYNRLFRVVIDCGGGDVSVPVGLDWHFERDADEFQPVYRPGWKNEPRIVEAAEVPNERAMRSEKIAKAVSPMVLSLILWAVLICRGIADAPLAIPIILSLISAFAVFNAVRILK